MSEPMPQQEAHARLAHILAAVQALAPISVNDEGGVSDGYYTCPMCDGEGSVSPPFHITTCGAAGLQVYGISDDLISLEAWAKEAPALTADILVGYRALRAQVAGLKAALVKVKANCVDAVCSPTPTLDLMAVYEITQDALTRAALAEAAG